MDRRSQSRPTGGSSVRLHKRLFCIGGLLGLGVAFAAPSLAAATDAGAQFKAIYTREWQWRQAQFAGADDEDSQGEAANHLPKVDAATQDMREHYWAEVIKQLDALPQAQLSAEDSSALN